MRRAAGPRGVSQRGEARERARALVHAAPIAVFAIAFPAAGRPLDERTVGALVALRDAATTHAVERVGAEAVADDERRELQVVVAGDHQGGCGASRCSTSRSDSVKRQGRTGVSQ